jgi:hypothetical protein
LLKAFENRAGGKPWKAFCPLSAMRILKIRENPLNVASNFVPVEFPIRLIAQTSHHVISSFLGI